MLVLKDVFPRAHFLNSGGGGEGIVRADLNRDLDSEVRHEPEADQLPEGGPSLVQDVQR